MGEIGGTANSIISVGAYHTKNKFVNTDNEEYSSNGSIGDFYFRSSRGPTQDGRIKPDIMAPGSLVAAADNSVDINFQQNRQILEVDRIDKPNGGKWSYTIRFGTSISSPIVAGIVALMLENNPELTPEEIKELLWQHAEQDNFTGTAPNNLWGHGKVNAHNTLTALNNPTSIASHGNIQEISIFPNPSDGAVFLRDIKPGNYTLRLIDLHGRTIHKQTESQLNPRHSLKLPDLRTGVYILQVESYDTVYQGKIIVKR